MALLLTSFYEALDVHEFSQECKLVFYFCNPVLFNG